MSVTDFGWLYRPDIVPVGLKRPSARIENLKSKFATIYIWMLGGSEVGVDLSLQQRNPKGSMIFLQGAPTDILYWVSSGLVDIVCPEADGGQIQASLLGPGDIFGFVEFSDSRGNPVQAFQSRARTHVQLGLITRDRVGKVLGRLDSPMLVHLLGEITAVWGSFTHYCAEFLGMNYSERLETVLKDLVRKFGVREARGTLLIPEFGHADFAEMIGCSRPMVSRLIAEMIANQRLAYDGKHYIVVGESATTVAN